MRNAPSIIDVKTKFGTTEQCVAYLEKMRWPEGVRCLVCGGDKISKFVSNETTRERTNRKGQTKEVRVPARHLYTCLEPTCNFQFSPTAGTIFHDTQLAAREVVSGRGAHVQCEKRTLRKANGARPWRCLSHGMVSQPPHP